MLVHNCEEAEQRVEVLFCHSEHKAAERLKRDFLVKLNNS